MIPFARLASKVFCVASLCALAACSVLEENKIDYKSSGKGVSLEVPPDLTQLSRDTRYVVPGTAVTASSFQNRPGSNTGSVAANSLGDVRLERLGGQRWLVINRPIEQLWSPVREFWQESGFLLTVDQADLGLLETDWAENRAKIPQDFIRNTIGKLLDALYSTGERDRFRTRLERAPGGGTEIFISHRGMVEVISSQSKEQTVWQPRANDPELEAEFLRRLMVKLGASPEQARTLQAATAKTTSRISTVNNMPVVLVDDGFDRAWRRVGLSLDRTGFTVEDRDRAQGIYFVRYVESGPDKKEPGFFAKIFSLGSADTTAPLKFRISLKSQGETTTVAVHNATGAPDGSANAQRIIRVIAEDLK